MFLRKLMVVLLPLLICVLLAVLFPFLSGTFANLGFFEFVVKGLLLGISLALLIPLMGGRKRETFTRLYWAPAVLLFLTILYQYLHQSGAVRIDALSFLAAISEQILMVESAFLGFMLTLSIRASR